jgi:FkbM family methyltransferase
VFIEIGANDGVQEDHLRPFVTSFPWTGVLVEPVPWIFERLRDNYREHQGVTFENAAIANADGSVPFYYVASAEERPTWSDAMGSLSRDVVEETIEAARRFVARGPGVYLPDPTSSIVQTEVPSLTFESLCRRHGIRELDLLAIDAQGYDYEIIKGIDFERHRPRLLIYESILLSADEREQSTAYLEGLGYETMYEGIDTWCHDPRADDFLARCWRSVRQRRRIGRLLHSIRTRLPARGSASRQG